MADFGMRFARIFLPLFVPLGMGPRRTRITVDGGALRVRMGWEFRATIPGAAVRSADRDHARVLGWGVHGWRGVWLVNGSSRGLVRMDIDPPARAWVIGFPVRLRTLRLSLEEPDAFLAALRSARLA